MCRERIGPPFEPSLPLQGRLFRGLADREGNKPKTKQHNTCDCHCKETVRSKFFTHDTPLKGRIPLGQVLNGLRRRQIAFARILINQVDDDVPHGSPPCSVW